MNFFFEFELVMLSNIVYSSSYQPSPCPKKNVSIEILGQIIKEVK
jgi:hypothetical protein